ncbi:GerAB/ArcD/ProY family transporter [Paenibacillus sp. Soil522]|uniref:GerAB/ArcD/ProY family transporter n=1 Tax=Paenibacillus sp. Soil522 TaxID=1736388 RepID=UPI0006F4FA50|nr:endospore germination permease [Paenibacillus sp. Soil522]KRE53629.1 spore gernimation protein [Paenibacillus sp. Soil522]
MKENDHIQANQFRKLVSLFIIGPSIILLPGVLASEAKQDAWISSIVGVIAALLLVWLYNTLASRFPGKTLVEISKEICGRWLGTIVSFLWFGYVFILSSLVLRNLGDFLTSSMLVETPINAIHFVYLSIVAVGVYYGVSNIARTADIFFPFVIALLCVFILLLVPDFEFKRVEPVLGKGIKPVLSAALPYIGFPFLELVLLLMIFPNVKQPKQAKKAFLSGTLIGGAVLFVITLMNILVMGAGNTASELYSSFELAKIIEIGEFIQRVEVIITAVWFITIFFKLILCFHISVLSLSQTLNLNDHRPLTLPLGMILYAVSYIIIPNRAYVISFDTSVRPFYALTFGFLLPLLLLGIAAVRKKR